MKIKNLMLPLVAVALFISNCAPVSKPIAVENIVKTAFNNLKLDLVRPFSKIEDASEIFAMNAQKENNFTFLDGSSTKIEKNIFEDKNGINATGEIKLRYRSIKSPASIIASGLHLLYKQGDSIVPFITGGMFEINATGANGEQLKLKAGKSITLNYSSIDSAKYNLYRFNETTKQWEEMGDANTFAKAEEPKNEPELLEPVAFDEEKDFVINVKVDYSKIRELAPYSKIIWKYTGTKSKNDLAKILGRKWESFELKKNEKERGKYAIMFNLNKTSEQIEVAPVFSKSAYNKAVTAYQKTNKKEVDNTMNSQSTRSVSVIQMGIYNLDVCSNPKVFAVKANVKFDNPEYNADAKLYKYFLISNNGQSITRFDLAQSNLLVYYKNSQNKLIGILPDNKVGVFSSNDFNSIKAKNSDNVTFNLRVLPDKIENENQLNDIIAKL